jgi:hypothetical protein
MHSYNSFSDVTRPLAICVIEIEDVLVAKMVS